MNRLLFSALFLLSILLPRVGHSQAFNVWLDPNGGPGFTGNFVECKNPNGPNTGGGTVVAVAPGANSYTWQILSPGPGSCQATFTSVSAPSNTLVNITYPCAGDYTVIVVAVNNTVATPPATVTADTVYATIIGANSATATAQPSLVCRGYTTQLTGNGGTTYTWIPSNGTQTTGNPVVVTPSVNTTYTMIATTPQNCTVTTTLSVLVSAATVAINPSTQQMCLGSPVCFTATAGPINSPSLTPGTTTANLQWYDPNGTPFSTDAATCTPAIGGNYTVVLEYNGTAGTCTTEAFSSVIITTNIAVSAASHSAQVCPGNNATLTATSVQTVANSYTWTAPGGATLVGNPVVFNQAVASCYTVDVEYFGCPGSETVCVGQASLTPTITPHSASICPGSTVELCASGGAFYTYYYLNPVTNFPTQIFPPNTNLCVIHSPSVNPLLPATYSVTAFSNGCVGSAVTQIHEFIIYPTFSGVSQSVCPNTPIDFTVGNVGAGSFTASAPYPGNPSLMYSGTSNSFSYTGTNVFPQTYTLEVDSAGCSGSTTTTIYSLTIQPTLSASSASTCPTQQFTLNATGGAGTSYTFFTSNTTPSNAITSGTSNSVALTPTLALPLNFVVTVDSAGCIGTDSFTMGILDLSSRVSLTVSPQDVCPASVFTITASMAADSYTFYSPTGTISALPTNTSIATHSLTQTQLLTNGIYTVMADSAGCTGTATVGLQLRTLNPDISASPNPVCAGMPVTLSSTGGTGSTYTFLKPDPNTILAVVGNSNQATNTATDNPGPLITTQYTVVVDSAQCLGRDTITVFIAPGLSVTASGSSPTICAGTTATLSAFGPTNAIYSWSQVSGTNSPVPVTGGSNLSYTVAAQGITVNPVVTTTYVVTGLDPEGCTGSATVVLAINPTASLSLVVSPLNTTICSGQNTTLTASGAQTFTWYPSTNLTPSANSPTVVAAPLQSTTYTVVGTNNMGCFGSSTVHVTMGSYPQITFAANAYSVCPGFNSTITAQGGQTYTWTGNTFTGSIAQQSLAAGPGCYTVTASNGGSCIRDGSICIGTAAPLQIQVSSSSPTTCIGNNSPKYSQAVTFTASGAGSYVWQPYNPAYMTYSLGPKTTVRPPASTCYTVTGYTNFCSGQQTICVTVIPQFSMNVTPPLPAICEGDSVRLSVTNVSSLAVGRPDDMAYRWYEPLNAPLSLSENLAREVISYPPETSTYTVEVIDSRLCASLPKIVTVTVFPRPITSVAIPTINNIATNTVCYVGVHTGPPDVVLTLQAINKNTNLPFGVVPTYTWLQPYNFPENSILTPLNQNQVTVNAPSREPAIAVYTVVSGYNGVPGCAEYDTISVRVVDCRPVSTVTTEIFVTAQEIDTVCSRECVTFMAISETLAGGPQEYEWEFPGGSPPTSTEKNPIVCYNLPSPDGYDVILRVRNPYPVQGVNGGPGGSEKVVGRRNYIKVVDVPNVTIVAPGGSRSDTTVRFGTPVQLTARGGKTFQWSPNYNITSLTDSSVTVKPYRSTRYIVRGYNSKSCASTDTIDVIVIEDCGEMFVPNAFSPNGDGHNDVLKVQGICLQTLSFMIFNRWGEKVFETTDQSVGWDGTYKGELMNTGVFVYRLEGKTYDGKAYTSKGNITLIR